MKIPNPVKLILTIGSSLSAGLLGTLFTASAIPTWYAGLEKPFFNPPSWLFGPVWTTLYILMGISAYLIWKNGLGLKNVREALLVFCIQLGLNALWSPIFFGLKLPGIAFVEIIALWAMVTAFMILSHRISKIAGWILAPYAIWVSFALILNYAIWYLNEPARLIG